MPLSAALNYHYMTHFYFVALSKCATLMLKQRSVHLHSFVCAYFVACNTRKVFNHQRHYDYFSPTIFQGLPSLAVFIAVAIVVAAAAVTSVLL